MTTGERKAVKRMQSWLKKIFAPPPKTERPPPQSINDLLRTSGKACGVALLNLALTMSENDFVEIVHCPALVGSAIREGDVVFTHALTRDLLTSQTSIFKAADIASLLKGGQLEHTIFMLRNDASSGHVAKYISFTIGRAKDNDIRIMDVAISRYHARVTISQEGFSISDLRSQNGTKVNGLAISDLPHILQDGDIVSMGRYEFSFLLPASLYRKLLAQKK